MASAPTFPIIALWSAPRSRSTAFFRIMLERGDLLALHEPFCNVTDHGETEVGDTVVHGHVELIRELRSHAGPRTVFFKDTTDNRYPAVLADTDFLAGARHTFLIRRPDEIARSFYAIDPGMCRADIGLESMYELYEAVLAAGGPHPVVLDSQELADRPAETMSAYCRHVGLPYRPEALQWQPGQRPEWHRTGEWHSDVAASSAVHTRVTRYAHTVANTPALAEFSAHHQPYYDRLYARRLHFDPVTG